MKTVLCYGDSLTWGYDAASAGRHPYDVRWPTVLQKGLGDDYSVIPEGLNGRTTMFDDHGAYSDRNGARTLPVALGTHQPIDLIVIMLGTNDMKRHTGGGRAFEARLGMERLVEIVQTFPYLRVYDVPKILIVAPPTFVAVEDEDTTLLLGHAIEESQRLADAYAVVAEEYGCDVFNAGEVCEVTSIDGFHLDAENTRRLGEALVEPVRQIFERG
ncbi:SGNH/GDSL hydrolase family protein [Aureimonas leprariae]|uniref:SGNH/GDSL hydrolase family protein n=1 Tax=Plantimonas leprariae TaxID=2615207 RepID=A0A7V7PRT8_9HYPH|nr:SGNH/GDSL hydrolase family protein [Aureimonas leprariae]KAB0681769.1 SGNH/GDSL hydrolase family protein [Aureimonas leprariae]